jgi:secreted protein with Ig-like and vWFA domain
MTSDARNPADFDSLDADDRDALLSAYALGELDGPEREFVERLLAEPGADDARRIVADTRTVAEAVRATRVADVPPRSPDLRRAVVVAAAGGPAAAPPAPVRRGSRTRLAAWLTLAGSLAAMLLVSLTVHIAALPLRHVAHQTPARKQAAPVDQPMEAAVGQPRLAMDAEVSTVRRTDAPPTEARRAASAGPPAQARRMPVPAEANDARIMSAVPPAADASSGPVETARAAAPAPAPARFRGAPAPAGRRPVVDREAPAVAADRDAAAGERYGRFEENRFLAVADRPLSTFSIDVDTASYAVVRRFLAAGRLPPRDAVRIEEFVNYFRYGYPRPDGDDPFAVTLEAADCPWRPGHRLVRIGIAGRDIDRARRPAGNLVFLVDVSGSMGAPDKLPLVKQALAMLVEELTENDTVSIVTYAGDAGLKLPPTSGDQKQTILDVIEGLAAGGSTHGSAGIVLAYEQARERFIPGGANRVILCTDGDLNVGITSDAALVDLVQSQARDGTFLTVLGFGQGNLQDEKLEAIADKGNGVYAYVDGVREARKVLVEQLTGSTIAIAKDVKIQVEFNPAQVASYRLVGYENRRLADADFRDDTKDAGEIGAGHTVTAIYEIVPTGAAAAGPGAGVEPLKYQPARPAAEPAPAPAADGPASAELLTVKLRFKEPEGDTSVLREFPLADRGGAFAAASADTRFAAAVAAFGMILRQSEFAGSVSLDDVAQIALDALGTDEGGHRAEFLDLVRKAAAIGAGGRR